MNKLLSIEQAIAQIGDGASIMVGGFGNPGTAFSLVNELLRQGQKHLTLIKNDANEAGVGISKLIENGQVDKLITTHIGLNREVVNRMNEQRISVEFHPQGILAEKIRTAGAGSHGFLSDIGLDAEITSPEQCITWQGQRYKVESALQADFALIHAHRADHYGNLVYRGSAANFNPIMAMAANKVIAETADYCPPGDILPQAVQTVCAFVDTLVALPQLSEEYGVLDHHVRY